MTEKTSSIPSRIKNATVGGFVTGAEDIDAGNRKSQKEVNQEVQESLGQGGSVDSRINDAKQEIIGDAASDYNTLGKLEDKIQAEATRAEAVEETLDGRVETLEDAVGTGGSVDSRISSAVSAEALRAQAAEADRYTKSETYTKEEVHNLITTPNQEYVSVTATDQTTAVTDVLPATGAADTTYRVGNWDGTQYNDSVFSEYAWNGSAYIKLSTKSQIGEVYDISANHAGTKYADLAAALNGGANIPQSLQKGGMSVKFIQSSDNNYMQFRFLLSGSFTGTQFANPDNWQSENVDEKPTVNSKNLVSSGGTEAAFDKINAYLFDKKITLEGEDNVFVEKRVGMFEDGKTVRLNLNTWEHTAALVGGVLFYIQKKIGNLRTNIINVAVGGTVQNYYEFTADGDAVYFVGGRADVGSQIEAHFVSNNIVYDEEFASTKATIEDERYRDKADYDETKAAITGKLVISRRISSISEKIYLNLKKGTFNIKLQTSTALSQIAYHKLYEPNGVTLITGLTINAGETSVTKTVTINQDYELAFVEFTRPGFDATVTVTVDNYLDLDIATLSDSVEQNTENIEANKKRSLSYSYSLDNKTYPFTEGKYIYFDDLKEYYAGSCQCISIPVYSGEKYYINAKADYSGNSHIHTFFFVNANGTIVYDHGQQLMDGEYICPSDGILVVNSKIQYSTSKVIRVFSNIDSPYIRDFLALNKNTLYRTSSCFNSINNAKTNFGIIAVTDLHGTFTSLKDAKALKDYVSGNRPIICLGDNINSRAISNGVLSNEVTEYMSLAEEYGVYHCMGQHEVGFCEQNLPVAGRNKNNCLTHDEAFDIFIEPLIDVCGFADASTMRTNKQNYWYKDFADNKTRFVSLYQYNIPLIDDPEDANRYKYPREIQWYGTEQLQWFANVLGTTPSNYNVVVIMHQIEGNITNIGSKFFTKAFSGGKQGTSGTPVTDIVSAYINRSIISQSYVGKSSLNIWGVTYDLSSLSMEVSYDFTNANGSFCCFITGDAHIDHVSHAGNTDILILGLTSSSKPSDEYVVNTNKKESSIVNAIGCMYSDKKIKMCRLGQDMSIYMTPRDFDSINILT